MAACLRLGAVLHASHWSGRFQVTCLRQLSVLAAHQTNNRRVLLDNSQLTCLVRIPHYRQEITFSRKRRRFRPRHKEDGVSTDMMVIYENNMNRFNFWGQLIINTMAVPIFGMSLNIVISSWPLQDWSITSGPLTASIYILLYSFLLFGVNTLCRRSIRRIYADADAANFAAVVQDWKMMPQTIYFDLSAAKRKAPGDMMGTFFGNLTINGRSFSTSAVDYVQPKFYNLLMGYDLGRSIDLDRVVDIDIKEVMQNRQSRLQKRPKDFK